MKYLHVRIAAARKYRRRISRMFGLLLANRVTWLNFKLSLRPTQKNVPLIGGGLVFCDREDENLYFESPRCSRIDRPFSS
jgi:hypothetical protein